VTIGQITSVDIEGTVDEFDQLGRQAFLDKYGFGLATTYLLHCRGRFYDPKAIVGVAHARTPGGQVLKPPEFDAPSAIRHLRHVGFEVVEFSGLWWVNQGGSYRAERDGGYLWAPQQTKGGYPVAHHTDVSKLRPGQLLIHYADNAIRALGRVAGEPTAATRPAELDATAWAEEGFFCPVDYLELAIRSRGWKSPTAAPESGRSTFTAMSSRATCSGSPTSMCWICWPSWTSG